MAVGEQLHKLSPEVIRQLKAQGLTQSDIARAFGVTRQAVSDMARKYNLELPPRREVLENHFPWSVPAQQQQQAPFRNMRNHGEWFATGGKGMTEDKLKRLRQFYQHLRDGGLVLEYDPALPPVPGVSKHGGFAFRKRYKRDAGLMIRVNEYTRLTDEGRDIWRVPLVDP